MFYIVDKLPEGLTEPRFYGGIVHGEPVWLESPRLATQYRPADIDAALARVRAASGGQVVDKLRVGEVTA